MIKSYRGIVGDGKPPPIIYARMVLCAPKHLLPLPVAGVIGCGISSGWWGPGYGLVWRNGSAPDF